jgi:hypothetical protein
MSSASTQRPAEPRHDVRGSAARLPGKALAVGLAIWFHAGLEKRREVQLAGSTMVAMGINRAAGYRGLAALEKAGLITVERHRGRRARVTLVGVDEEDRAAGPSPHLRAGSSPRAPIRVVSAQRAP